VVNPEELEKLFEDGYRVVISYPLLNHTPQEINGFVSFFKTKLSLKEALHPTNRNKNVVVLSLPTGQQVEVVTTDEAILNRINKRIEYQNEPIGMAVRACLALSGRSTYGGVAHLDRLVESLDGLWGWEFKLGDDGTFNVVINLERTDKECGEHVREKLQRLLDCLAIIFNVGFYIQQFSCVLRPRFGPYVLGAMWMSNLRQVTPDEICNIGTVLSSDKKSLLAARGLNQSYIENCMPSRLSMLWAAAEHLFRSKSEPLLTKDEINQILESAKNVESLKNDPNRLKALKKAISDPSRLPLKSRNWSMAENIASTMDISVESAYSNLSKASKLRGKNVHQLSDDWEDIKEVEKFLQDALLSYLKQKMIIK